MVADAVFEYIKRSAVEPSSLSMTGTGLNGAIQVPLLAKIGTGRLNALKKVNVISGSSYSYFILQAYSKKMLREDIFLSFDKLNRTLHSSNFLVSLARLFPILFMGGSFFKNDTLDVTSGHLFKKEFCELRLKDFSDNLSVWSYCTNRKENIEISNANGFGDMTVYQLIRACISLRFLHGPFHYQDYSFVDPNFTKFARKSLLKKLFSDKNNHLVINYSKNETRGNMSFVKHTLAKHPNLEIAKDIFFFTFNISNQSIYKTHQRGLKELKEGSIEWLVKKI